MSAIWPTKYIISVKHNIDCSHDLGFARGILFASYLLCTRQFAIVRVGQIVTIYGFVNADLKYICAKIFKYAF